MFSVLCITPRQVSRKEPLTSAQSTPRGTGSPVIVLPLSVPPPILCLGFGNPLQVRTPWASRFQG